MEEMAPQIMHTVFISVLFHKNIKTHWDHLNGESKFWKFLEKGVDFKIQFKVREINRRGDIPLG